MNAMTGGGVLHTWGNWALMKVEGRGGFHCCSATRKKRANLHTSTIPCSFFLSPVFDDNSVQFHTMSLTLLRG